MVKGISPCPSPAALVAGVALLAASAPPAGAAGDGAAESAAEAARTVSCPAFASSYASGTTLRITHVRSDVGCRAARRTVHGFHSQQLGSSGATVALGFSCGQTDGGRAVRCTRLDRDSVRLSWRVARDPVVARRRLRLGGRALRIRALRVSAGMPSGMVQHAVELQVRSGGRWVRRSLLKTTLATAQPGAGDFCGMRVVGRTATTVRVRHCAVPSASVGRVATLVTVTAQRLVRASGARRSVASG